MQKTAMFFVKKMERGIFWHIRKIGLIYCFGPVKLGVLSPFAYWFRMVLLSFRTKIDPKSEICLEIPLLWKASLNLSTKDFFFMRYRQFLQKIEQIADVEEFDFPYSIYIEFPYFVSMSYDISRIHFIRTHICIRIYVYTYMSYLYVVIYICHMYICCCTCDNIFHVPCIYSHIYSVYAPLFYHACTTYTFKNIHRTHSKTYVNIQRTHSKNIHHIRTWYIYTIYDIYTNLYDICTDMYDIYTNIYEIYINVYDTYTNIYHTYL